MNNQKINLQTLNPDGQIKWNVNIIYNEDAHLWDVEDSAEYSLFPGPLASSGLSIGAALDNFLAIEQELINNL